MSRGRRLGVLLLALGGAVLLARIVWLFSPMSGQKHYATLRAQETLQLVGLAAIKYEYCFKTLPAGIDDLVRVGYVRTSADDRDWDVPDIGSISGNIARSLVFESGAQRNGTSVDSQGLTRPFVRLPGMENNGDVRRTQMRVAKIREDLRLGRSVDLDTWLTDCEAEGPQAGEGGEVTSQPKANGLP